MMLQYVLQNRTEAFALLTHATKLYHVVSHVLELIPEAAVCPRSSCVILVDSAKNAMVDIQRSYRRIEDAPGAWEDKWSIFGHQLALGVSHTANFSYLVYGGIVLDGANAHIGQETIEQLTAIRKYAIVVGNAALEENPPALLRKSFNVT